MQAPASPTQPAPTTAPSPTSSPTVAPAPTPTIAPVAGGTVVAGTYYSFTLPPGWSAAPAMDAAAPNAEWFHGPRDQVLSTDSVATSRTLDEAVALLIANVKSTTGADPEQTAITMGGAPGRLLAYHLSSGSSNMYVLHAFCVHNGRGYEIMLGDAPGNESADRADLMGILASFAFLNDG